MKSTFLLAGLLAAQCDGFEYPFAQLAKLKEGDAHRHLQTLRRLDTVDDACMEACPRANEVLMPIMEAASGLEDIESINPDDILSTMVDGLGTTYKLMMEAMCTDADVFECLEMNEDVCSGDGDDDDDLLGSMEEFQAASDCLCTACPGSAGVFGEMIGASTGLLFGALMSMGEGDDMDSGPDETELMNTLLPIMCPAVGAMECFEANPSVCATILEDDDDMGDDMMGDDMMGDDDGDLLDIDPEELGPICQGLGISTELNADNDDGKLPIDDDDEGAGQRGYEIFLLTPLIVSGAVYGTQAIAL